MHGLLDGHGVGVFTEWKRRREVTRATFGPFTPWKTGCGNPTVQVGGRSKTWGFTLGHKAVAGVCGPRWVAWQTVEFEGLKVGVVGVHPTPKGAVAVAAWPVASGAYPFDRGCVASLPAQGHHGRAEAVQSVTSWLWLGISTGPVGLISWRVGRG